MTDTFLSGVIEGFYGRPWTQVQRFELLEWLSAWGLNTYVYAPKDDLKLRAAWHDLYDEAELKTLRELATRCAEEGVAFIYTLSPGLSICYSSEDDLRTLKQKVDQLLELGVNHFSLLFDDIPSEMLEADAARFGSFAEAQSYVTNELFTYVRRTEGLFFFCPTDYCARMVTPSVTGSSYLKELGERLHPDIDVFWTGPEIVSETISVASIRELQTVLKRKPLIWDNLHANDYDLRRLYLGPYKGRSSALKKEVRGVLSNPNTEFEANFVPLETLARYVQDGGYEPRRAYSEALKAWLPRFRVRGEGQVTLGELELLGDLCYLFCEHGTRAEAVLRRAQKMLETPPEQWGNSLGQLETTVQEVQSLFRKLTLLENRDLLYAVYAYLWELEHELRYLVRYLKWVEQGKPGDHFAQPEQVTNTFRGGLSAAIGRLLPLSEEGRLLPKG